MTTSDINIYTHTARDCGEARGLQRRRRQGDGPGRFRSSGLVYYPASILHQLYPRSMMGPDLVSPTATQCCIAHNVHFLDGVHFMHSARLPVLHHALKDLGKVRGCGRRGRAGEGKSWTRGMGSQPSKSCCRRITNDPTPFPHPQIRRISTEFTFKADAAFLQDNIRVSAATEPLGALGDLGWCVQWGRLRLMCGSIGWPTNRPTD